MNWVDIALIAWSVASTFCVVAGWPDISGKLTTMRRSRDEWRTVAKFQTGQADYWAARYLSAVEKDIKRMDRDIARTETSLRVVK